MSYESERLAALTHSHTRAVARMDLVSYMRAVLSEYMSKEAMPIGDEFGPHCSSASNCVNMAEV